MIEVLDGRAFAQKLRIEYSHIDAPFINDREVQLARLFGANKEYIECGIPHISSLMRSTLTEVLDASEVIVIGKKDEEFCKLAESPQNGHVFIDLVHSLDAGVDRKDYLGMCW